MQRERASDERIPLEGLSSATGKPCGDKPDSYCRRKTLWSRVGCRFPLESGGDQRDKRTSAGDPHSTRDTAASDTGTGNVGARQIIPNLALSDTRGRRGGEASCEARLQPSEQMGGDAGMHTRLPGYRITLSDAPDR